MIFYWMHTNIHHPVHMVVAVYVQDIHLELWRSLNYSC